LERFDPGDSGGRPEPGDFLGLHRGNALDWLHATAMLARPDATQPQLKEAIQELESCLAGHPATPLGAWSGEVLEAFASRHSRGPQARLSRAAASHARVASRTNTLVRPAPQLERFTAGVVKTIRGLR